MKAWEAEYMLSWLSTERFKLSQLICHYVGKHLQLVYPLFIMENMSSTDTNLALRPALFFRLVFATTIATNPQTLFLVLITDTYFSGVFMIIFLFFFFL